MKNSPVLRCAICGQPVSLTEDRSADERGKPVHENCYLDKITRGVRCSDESKFDVRA
jgi:hypothetical protein